MKMFFSAKKVMAYLYIYNRNAINIGLLKHRNQQQANLSSPEAEASLTSEGNCNGNMHENTRKEMTHFKQEGFYHTAG